MASVFRTWMDPEAVRRRLEIADLREELLEQKGYCIVRGFCSTEETMDVRNFWNHYPLPPGPKGYWRGRGNYSMSVPCIQRYECFFWNQPEHLLTYELAWSAQLLRNLLWRLPLHSHILPFEGFACSFRVTRTDAGDKGVPAHTDELYREDLKHRIQASLALSTLGLDFDGGGTRFRTREGNFLNIHGAEQVRAGDLVFFDQLLEHSVDPVERSRSEESTSGHWRMIMPDHLLSEKESQSKRARYVRLVKRLLSRDSTA